MRTRLWIPAFSDAVQNRPTSALPQRADIVGRAANVPFDAHSRLKWTSREVRKCALAEVVNLHLFMALGGPTSDAPLLGEFQPCPRQLARQISFTYGFQKLLLGSRSDAAQLAWQSVPFEVLGCHAARSR